MEIADEQAVIINDVQKGLLWLTPGRQILAGNLAHLSVPYPAIRSKDHRKRQASTDITQRFAQAYAVQIDQSHWKADWMPFQELKDSVRLINGKSKNLPAFYVMFTVEGVKKWQLFNAWRTPGGPEIDQQWLPAHTGHDDFPGRRTLKLKVPKTSRYLRIDAIQAESPPCQSRPAQPRNRSYGRIYPATPTNHRGAYRIHKMCLIQVN
jgi:hypothetical protein